MSAAHPQPAVGHTPTAQASAGQEHTAQEPAAVVPPLLVASDVDGTLITSKERITPRLRRVLERMTHQGTVLALATGRPPRWIFPVLEQLHVRPICVCANGAILYDSKADTILRAHTLSPETLRTIAAIARRVLPDVGFAVERGGHSAFAPTQELFAVSPTYAHAWESVEHGVKEEELLFAQPAIKLLLRCEGASSAEMFAQLCGHIDPKLAHLTYSIPDGLLELAAPGVTKATGVAELAALVGASPAEVVCFGDMPNDCEMLEWAGLGVAMGNAAPEVKASADEVTTSCDEDGVARVLERWF